MMLKRELLRVGLCAAAGLVIGLLYAGPSAMAPFAFYVIGLFYGIRFVLPALLGALKTLGNGSVMSIAFKNPIGVIILLIIAVLAIGILVTVAWIVGIFTAGLRLWQAFQEDRTMGTTFRPHIPTAGRSRPGAGSTSRRKDDWDDDGWDSSPAGSSGGSGGWDSDDWNSDGWDD